MLYAWYMFDMLTPMLYIFVWPKRWGAIRDKGFAHVPIVEFKALDQVYRVCIAHGMFDKEIHGCTPIFMGHVDISGEGGSPCARLGIQVGELFANGSNHLCIES